MIGCFSRDITNEKMLSDNRLAIYCSSENGLEMHHVHGMDSIIDIRSIPKFSFKVRKVVTGSVFDLISQCSRIRNTKQLRKKDRLIETGHVYIVLG